VLWESKNLGLNSRRCCLLAALTLGKSSTWNQYFDIRRRRFLAWAATLGNSPLPNCNISPKACLILPLNEAHGAVKHKEQQ
jgi:hypothetical protein